MIALITQGEYVLFACLMAALIASLTCHEFGHAWVAKLFGDDTAEQAGRLSLNPLVHLDLMGLAMVVLLGFGYPSQYLRALISLVGLVPICGFPPRDR